MCLPIKKTHALLLCIALIPSLLFLGIKATNPYGWDNWGFGSAQTMLTIRYWARDGFIPHKLLFIPSGYSPYIQLLDTPQFRFLSNGIKTGGLIGPRLYYTHYPSGYLVPFGVLAKLGIEERVWFRLLAILISAIGACFLYGFVYLLTDKNKWIAFVATVYYVTSTTFLGYADSLANMPIDDLLKYAILFSSIYSEHSKKYIWPLFFILSLSSYDSTLFVAFWLCALHIIETKKLHFRYYAYIISAPAIAFGIQLLQNWWYLGTKDMFLDMLGAFTFRASEIPPVLQSVPPLLQKLFATLSTLGYLTDLRTRTALPLLLLLIPTLYYMKKISSSLALRLSTLGIGGLLYGYIVPIAGTFGYQGRQVAPFLLIIIGIATYTCILTIKNSHYTSSTLLVSLLIIVIWGAHALGTARYIHAWPNSIVPQSQIQEWKELSKGTDHSTIILGPARKVGTGFELFFAQVYTDRLMLPFINEETAIYYYSKLRAALPDSAHLLLVQ